MSNADEQAFKEFMAAAEKSDAEKRAKEDRWNQEAILCELKRLNENLERQNK